VTGSTRVSTGAYRAWSKTRVWHTRLCRRRYRAASGLQGELDGGEHAEDDGASMVGETEHRERNGERRRSEGRK
jgi:hypothetical protein